MDVYYVSLQPSLRILGRNAFTRTDEHSGFSLLQAAVFQGDYDTVTKASVHLESFVEEMNCRTTGGKASIFPGKSAADILSAVKGRMGSHLIGDIYIEFVDTEITLCKLHSCAKRSDIEMAIELVLNDGIDVNVAAKRNITPLLWASTVASSLSIKTLIDLGADVNAQTFQGSSFCFSGSTALHFAIHGNNAAVVKVLLTNNANASVRDYWGDTPLRISTREGFANVSQLLIDSACEINARNNSDESPLQSAVHSNNLAHVELLLKNNANADVRDYSGDTPLHISSLKGFTNISQLLIDSGCEINARNNSNESPLHSAVLGKNVAGVELLLKKNANTDIRNYLGNTPLHISSLKGFANISQLLIDSGCEINARNNVDESPLHSAVHSNNLAHVELLLKNNANADVRDYSGNTSLHISSLKGFTNISQLLIDSGCNKNLKNKVGKTPLDVEPFSLRSGDLEEGKGDKGYALLKSFLESEDENDPLMNQPTHSTMPSPIVFELKEQSSIEGSGILLKNRQELSSSEESKSKIGKEEVRTPRV